MRIIVKPALYETADDLKRLFYRKDLLDLLVSDFLLLSFLF